MSNRIKHIIRGINQWSFLTVIIGLFICVPFFAILVYLFDGTGPMWSHIRQYFILDYLNNSIILLFGTGILTTLIGVSSAWIVSVYDFPLRKYIAWILFLPLAIPSYIMAYSYVGLLGNGGLLIGVMQSLGISIQRIEMMHIFGLIWVLSFSLYPYVYASTRAVFLSYPKSLRESVYLLGGSNKRYFYRVALPLASPAIIAGLFLVFMEVLNDYGAAKYYGINTFTTGIFRIWTALEDLQSAIYLSALLVLVILGISMLSKALRGKKSYSIDFNTVEEQQSRKKLAGLRKFALLAILAIPIIFGLILPLIQLIYWAIQTHEIMLNASLISTAIQSILLAAVTALVVVCFSLVLIYVTRWNRLEILKSIKNMVTVGYVIPGAIIGIAIIRSSQQIIDFFQANLNMEIGYLFYNSSFVLIYAYLFRFIAVAYNPIESNMLKVGKQLYESSYLLGTSKLKTLWKIELPLIRNVILSSFILVFIDTLKELPLTLILKPYKMHTLAVTAFEYAEDERVAEAAIPSLTLIMLIIIFMIVVHWIDKSVNKKTV